ncbi:MAG: type II secretion system major pseudopilin GspG [Opitutales bacterium]|nr:type II secretion system major pseudopilin GspG [Opitutales bacterium]
MNLSLSPHSAFQSYPLDRKTTHRSAFTILEVVVVLAIIVLIISLGITQVTRIFEGSSEQAAEIWVEDSIQAPLTTFRIHMGRYPTTEEGLQALITDPTGGSGNWRGPYLNANSVPKDPWGNEYQYRYPGQRNDTGPDVFSFGPDGVDSDQNIGNW